MDSAITIRHLTFSYKGADQPALADISLSVAPGECLLVTGPAGAGKSTLCHCLNGLVPQVLEGRLRGEIRVAGKDAAGFRVQTLSKAVGLVMQDPEVQIVGRTVAEDLAFGPRNYLVPAGEIPGRAARGLELAGLAGYEQYQTADLSGGEKQRLALAGILTMDTPILVLDEPASELDPAGRAALYRNLARLNRENATTLVIVEQRIDDLLDMADRVLFLDRGRATGLAHAGDVPEISAPPLPDGPAGPADSSLPCEGAPAAIEVRNLSFAPSRPVLTGISLIVRQQDFIALMGHNGAGKTSLAKHLNGLVPPPRGTVFYRGRDIAALPTPEITRAVGFVFQNPDHQIFESTVEREVGAGLAHRGLPPEEIRDRVDRALDLTGLLPYCHTHPFTLGKGLRQLVALAGIVVLDPEVLVVDEPTTGLDARGIARVMEILSRLNRAGTAIVFITHDLGLAAAYGRRLVVMKQGRIILDAGMEKALGEQETLGDAGLLPGRGKAVP